MTEEIEGKYKYLVSQGWSLEDAKEYVGLQEKKGMSPIEAHKYLIKKKENSKFESDELDETTESDELDETSDDKKTQKFGDMIRKPIKEFVVRALEGKPKTTDEIEIEDEYKKERHRAKLETARQKGYESIGRKKKIKTKYYDDNGEGPTGISESRIIDKDKSLSLKDLGRGNVGTEIYESTEPPRETKSIKFVDTNFVGLKGFFMGTKNPLGKSSREKISPPSMSIGVFGGSDKPPSTSMSFGISKPPSTSMSFGISKPPSTSMLFGISKPPQEKTKNNKNESKKILKNNQDPFGVNKFW